MKRFLLLLLLLVAVPVFAAPPEGCTDISASSTDHAATFTFNGCPLVFNLSTKQAYVSFYGTAATSSMTPVAPSSISGVVGGAAGICVVQTKVVHVIMAGSDTGTVRVCNYGGTQ